MKIFKAWTTLACLVLFVIGCGSPKDATKENFTKAIDAHLVKNDIIISLSDNNFPVTMQLAMNEWLKERVAKSYDALVKIGFLDVKETEKEQKNLIGNGSYRIPVKIYSLTEKGKQAFVEKSDTHFYSGFRVAKQKVKEIINFSEPSPVRGYTVTNVKYSVAYYEISEWAKDQDVLDAFPQIAREIDKTQTSKSATLVLMNDGWIHEKEMRL